jgi:hypothetical protein
MRQAFLVTLRLAIDRRDKDLRSTVERMLGSLLLIRLFQQSTNMLRLAARRKAEHIAPALDATRVLASGRCPGRAGGHRLPAPIVSKDELIEIGLELRAADAVIGADQPVLQIPDRAIREGHDRGGALAQGRAQRLLEGDVPVTSRLQADESPRPSV